MENYGLGAKIRSYRQERNLSIQTLVSQVGITPSMLSQIERELANPSINTLKLISQALGVPLFLFFTDGDMGENAVVRKDSRKYIRTQKDGISTEYELLTPNANGSIEFMLQRFAPHSDSGSSVQFHIGEEVAYVLTGKLLLTLDKSQYCLTAGDSVRIPPMVSHIWENHSDKEAILIFAITPPSF